MTAPSHRTAATPDVIVHGDRIRARHAHTDLSHTEARHRFGGFDVPAALAGVLAGLGALVILAGILAGAGSFGYQQGVRGADTLSLAGLVSGLVALLLCGLVTGWVSGRAARYDGLRNGLLAALFLLILTGAIGALGTAAGARYDIASQAHLPTWVSSNATSGRALVSAIAGLVVLLVGAALGGKLGSRWHRQVDDAVAGTRAGGITAYPTETGR